MRPFYQTYLKHANIYFFLFGVLVCLSLSFSLPLSVSLPLSLPLPLSLCLSPSCSISLLHSRLFLLLVCMPSACTLARSASVPGEVSRVPRHRRLSMFDSDIPALPLSCLPQLSDIVMLLDSSSPQKDIKQLHMNYSRSKNGRSSADGMPSLRKLIRPTDWESVHASVTAYAAKCGRPSVSEKTLGPLCFRRPDGPHKSAGLNSILFLACSKLSQQTS